MDIAPIWTPQFSALISAHGMAALNFLSCMSFNFNEYISNFKLYNYKPQDDKTKSLTAWSHDFRAARETELEWNKRDANLYPKKIGENRGGKEWEISFSELQKFMMKKKRRTKHQSNVVSSLSSPHKYKFDRNMACHLFEYFRIWLDHQGA